MDNHEAHLNFNIIQLAKDSGRRITIYDIAEILGKCYHHAFTNSNCISGFRETGIYPFNKNIFGEHDFIAASVTDFVLEEIDNSPCISTCAEPNIKESKVTPEMIRPYPKARRSERVESVRKRKTTKILTSTPVKQRIEAKHVEKQAKQAQKKKIGAKRKLFGENMKN
ncbi:hypothetical protein CBL_05084 [Carabus blaptoides fortunei]